MALQFPHFRLSIFLLTSDVICNVTNDFVQLYNVYPIKYGHGFLVVISCWWFMWFIHVYHAGLLHWHMHNHTITITYVPLASIHKADGHLIAKSREVAKPRDPSFRFFQSLRNLTSTSEAALSRFLSNFRVIRSLFDPISYVTTTESAEYNPGNLWRMLCENVCYSHTELWRVWFGSKVNTVRRGIFMFSCNECIFS